MAEQKAEQWGEMMVEKKVHKKAGKKAAPRVGSLDLLVAASMAELWAAK